MSSAGFASQTIKLSKGVEMMPTKKIACITAERFQLCQQNSSNNNKKLHQSQSSNNKKNVRQTTNK
jgi:hypothetical protein